MGRVYDALRRAHTTTNQTSDGQKKGKVRSIEDERRRVAAEKSASADLKELNDRRGIEKLFSFAPATAPAIESASTAHTEERTGSALSGVLASRSAGATLDAAGSARAELEYVSLDISAARVEPHLVTVTQPRSAYCEHFRALRTKLLHAAEQKNMRAFVITSAGVAEGKTLTTLNLAWMLAQTDGVRALLIDADLRRPCATDYFGIEDRKGLSEVLAGEATLNDCLVRLNPAGLYLLPGGAQRDNVAELLSGPTFNRVLAEARKMFDYVLIDAPPLGIFTDATVLINRADAALLVVRAGKTRYSVVDRLLDQMPRERILGVVLNRSSEEINESEYYYNRERRYRGDEDRTQLAAGELQGGQSA
jgi:capsular exopolysaccharide synthesis family protein